CDGMLLNWLTPADAAAQVADAHATAPGTHVALYVRTALDAGGVPRLQTEARRYAGFPKYAANFARLGIDAADTVITPDGAALPAYRAAVDEVVLRAMTASDDIADYRGFIDRAATLV